MMLTKRDINRSGLYASLGPRFGQIFGQILSIRVKTPSKDTVQDKFGSVKTQLKGKGLTSG